MNVLRFWPVTDPKSNVFFEVFVVSRAGITQDGMSGLLNKEAGRSLTDAACWPRSHLLQFMAQYSGLASDE